VSLCDLVSLCEVFGCGLPAVGRHEKIGACPVGTPDLSDRAIRVRPVGTVEPRAHGRGMAAGSTGAPSFNRPYGTTGSRGRRQSQAKASLRDDCVSNLRAGRAINIAATVAKLTCVSYTPKLKCTPHSRGSPVPPQTKAGLPCGNPACQTFCARVVPNASALSTAGSTKDTQHVLLLCALCAPCG